MASPPLPQHGILHVSPTFPRPCGDVGLNVWPVGEGFGPDSEPVRYALGQVLHLHPQRAVPLHVHCHDLTDACREGG